jgi:hypothetical protein
LTNGASSWTLSRRWVCRPTSRCFFPFVEATGIGPDTPAKLGPLAVSVRSFQFRLTHAGWFEQHVLRLAPDPEAPFVELTARAAHAFPDYPPYGGQFTDVVPA